MSVIVSIEGNIGSGKTTILKCLKEHFKNNTQFVFVDEPVKEWIKIKYNDCNILEKFYQDPNKYSFSFQMMAYITRLSMLKKAVKENPNAVIITERCLYTDKFVFAQMLYDQGSINEYEFQIYNKWFDEFISDLPKHKFIFISSDPNKSKERINQRQRQGEENITVSYLTDCENYHSKMSVNNSLDILMNINIENYELHTIKYYKLIDKIINNLKEQTIKKNKIINYVLHSRFIIKCLDVCSLCYIGFHMYKYYKKN